MMYLEHKASLELLINGCRKNNARAQEALYNLFSSRMLVVCLRYSTDKMEAEDILQTGFIKMFDKIGEFRMEGSFEGWLRKIMIHTGLEYFRKRSKMVKLEEISGDFCLDESVGIPIYETEYLLLLIQNLSPGFRMVFNLYAIDGFSHKEIASLLNISEGTSKSQLARARNLLQKELMLQEKLNGYGK